MNNTKQPQAAPAKAAPAPAQAPAKAPAPKRELKHWRDESTARQLPLATHLAALQEASPKRVTLSPELITENLPAYATLEAIFTANTDKLNAVKLFDIVRLQNTATVRQGEGKAAKDVPKFPAEPEAKFTPHTLQLQATPVELAQFAVDAMLYYHQQGGMKAALCAKFDKLGNTPEQLTVTGSYSAFDGSESSGSGSGGGGFLSNAEKDVVARLSALAKTDAAKVGRIILNKFKEAADEFGTPLKTLFKNALQEILDGLPKK